MRPVISIFNELRPRYVNVLNLKYFVLYLE